MPRIFVVSRIGVGGRTVVPKAVRKALNLGPGDPIGFVIESGRVELVKPASLTDGPFAYFEEWSGEADTTGYASL